MTHATGTCPECHGEGYKNVMAVRCANCGKAFPKYLEAQDDVCPECGACYCLSGTQHASDIAARYGSECLVKMPPCPACERRESGEAFGAMVSVPVSDAMSDVFPKPQPAPTFPVLQESVIPGVPEEVSWLLVELHEARAEANHQQSLNRLAARGGLSARELAAVICDVPFVDVKQLPDDFIRSMIVAANNRCLEHDKTLQAAKAPAVETFVRAAQRAHPNHRLVIGPLVRDFAATILNA